MGYVQFGRQNPPSNKGHSVVNTIPFLIISGSGKIQCKSGL